jgi:hypothetical protein
VLQVAGRRTSGAFSTVPREFDINPEFPSWGKFTLATTLCTWSPNLAHLLSVISDPTAGAMLSKAGRATWPSAAPPDAALHAATLDAYASEWRRSTPTVATSMPVFRPPRRHLMPYALLTGHHLPASCTTFSSFHTPLVNTTSGRCYLGHGRRHWREGRAARVTTRLWSWREPWWSRPELVAATRPWTSWKASWRTRREQFCATIDTRARTQRWVRVRRDRIQLHGQGHDQATPTVLVGGG